MDLLMALYPDTKLQLFSFRSKLINPACLYKYLERYARLVNKSGRNYSNFLPSKEINECEIRELCSGWGNKVIGLA